MRLAVGIILVAVGFLAAFLVAFVIWAHHMFTVGVNGRAVALFLVTFVALLGVGLRLIFDSLRRTRAA